MFSPFYEYSNLEYEQFPVQYRVHQAEYGIHIRVAASQEYVNIYSTRRARSLKLQLYGDASPWPKRHNP